MSTSDNGSAAFLARFLRVEPVANRAQMAGVGACVLTGFGGRVEDVMRREARVVVADVAGR